MSGASKQSSATPSSPSGTGDGIQGVRRWGLGHHSPRLPPPGPPVLCCSRPPSCWCRRSRSARCRSSSRWAIFHLQYREAWIFFLLNISDFLRRFWRATRAAVSVWQPCWRLVFQVLQVQKYYHSYVMTQLLMARAFLLQTHSTHVLHYLHFLV